PFPLGRLHPSGPLPRWRRAFPRPWRPWDQWRRWDRWGRWALLGLELRALRRVLAHPQAPFRRSRRWAPWLRRAPARRAPAAPEAREGLALRSIRGDPSDRVLRGRPATARSPCTGCAGSRARSSSDTRPPLVPPPTVRGACTPSARQSWKSAPPLGGARDDGASQKPY